MRWLVVDVMVQQRRFEVMEVCLRSFEVAKWCWMADRKSVEEIRSKRVETA
jgi:hypothetical protein